MKGAVAFMADKLKKFLNMKYSELAVCLIYGLSYYVVILDFILRSTKRAGGLLGLFIAPAVICGLALVFIKSIRRKKENEDYKSIAFIMAANTLIFVFSCLLVISYIFCGAR